MERDQTQELDSYEIELERTVKSVRSGSEALAFGKQIQPDILEEGMQETALSALMSKNSVYLDCNVFASISCKRAQSILKKKRNQKTVPLDDVEGHLVDDSSDPSRALIQVEESEMIREALDKLPSESKALILRLPFATQKEIADELGISPAALSQRKAKLWRQLREKLSHLAPGNQD